MHKLPVTVITGFLGAGKTTLIRHLLTHNQGRRIAVLVNEFGEVGIDGDLLRTCEICDDPSSTETPDSQILELANGCLCCTVQEEFLPTMRTLLQRRQDLDCILIETSGLALPKPLIQAFRWPDIRTGATVDGVITVVDAEALAQGQFVGNLSALEAQRQADDSLDHETPLAELFDDQLACADLVLLTKTDHLSAATCDRVTQWLQQRLSPGVKLIGCQQGRVDPAVLLGFNAAVETDLENRPSHHDTAVEHDHDHSITSVTLDLAAAFDPEVLVARLTALVHQHSVYRIKGFVVVPQKAMRLVLQAVGPRFDQFYDRPWHPDEPRHTRLVFIGQELDAEQIRRAIAADQASSETNWEATC